jgi:hypothetical protein
MIYYRRVTSERDYGMRLRLGSGNGQIIQLLNMHVAISKSCFVLNSCYSSCSSAARVVTSLGS